jgi:hypothetical protein
MRRAADRLDVAVPDQGSPVPSSKRYYETDLSRPNCGNPSPSLGKVLPLRAPTSRGSGSFEKSKGRRPLVLGAELQRGADGSVQQAHGAYAFTAIRSDSQTVPRPA